jgi:hypothetical protein
MPRLAELTHRVIAEDTVPAVAVEVESMPAITALNLAPAT